MALNATELIGGKPELTYFHLPQDLKGRGGPIRLFFSLHGIEYDFVQLTFDEWPVLKKELIESKANPAGKLPVVRIGGKVFPEHVAVLRFLSRKLGLYGNSGEELRDYVLDAVADQYQSYRSGWAQSTFGSDNDKQEWKDTKRADHLGILENYYSKHAGETPYLLGSEIPTFVDILIFSVLEDDAKASGDALTGSEYPHLKVLFDTVSKLI